MRGSPVAKDATIFARDINALRSDARGAAVLSAHQTLGKLALPTNPSDGQTATFTINGTAIAVRFKSTLAAANDVKIGADAATTSSNLFNFLTNPHTTNSLQIAASAANQILLGYLAYTTVATTTYIGSVNKVVNPILTSFSCSTTVTSGVYTANTMTLVVQAGTAYVNGTEVKFAGGLAPTVTAPASNPRIDLLSIDSSGTLAWTTGSENASPTAPTYPANKLPICEIYNVVGETQLLDSENQTSGQGYVLYDVRPTVTTPLNPAAITTNLLPQATDTYNLGSASFEWNEIRGKTIYQNGSVIASQKFGGTGADGALSISSGTTTLNVGSASYFEKNYTSISITGTGNLAFSSPNNTTGTVVALKTTGNVTMTSSSTHVVDVRSMGGGPGTASTGFFIADTGNTTLPAAAASGGSTSGDGLGSVVTVGATPKQIFSFTLAGRRTMPINPATRSVPPGGNGMDGVAGWDGGGIGSNGTGGTGGLGGGGLYFECGGAWNFTTGTIDASGGAGSNGTNGTSFHTGGAGGGAGAGGNVLVLWTSLTADSGSYNVAGSNTGGTKGTGFSPTADGNGGAANGSTYRGANSYFA